MIVKVCGLTEAKNIRQVEQCGADLLGFICYAGSPRFVPRAPAYLPRRARRIGVFVNAPLEYILRRAAELGLHGVQLHGSEPPALCQTLRRKGLTVIKAFVPRQAADLTAAEAYADACHYFLFDTPCPQHGGSGRTFDWTLLRHYRGDVPFLLSGGLRPDSLDALRAFSHPRWAGIDLNSGFETRPGMKDIGALAGFINAIKAPPQPSPVGREPEANDKTTPRPNA